MASAAAVLMMITLVTTMNKDGDDTLLQQNFNPIVKSFNLKIRALGVATVSRDRARALSLEIPFNSNLLEPACIGQRMVF